MIKSTWWEDRPYELRIQRESWSFFGGLVDEGLVNMRDDTPTSNGALNKGIKFLVSSDSKLQMPGCDPLHFQIFACISSKLKNLSCQVFKNGGQVNCSCCPNTPIRLDPLFQLSMDTTHRKLDSGTGWPRNRPFLILIFVLVSSRGFCSQKSLPSFSRHFLIVKRAKKPKKREERLGSR